MHGFIIAIIAYVGWMGSPSQQPPSQRANRPAGTVLTVPVLGHSPRQEPSTYG